MWQQMMNMYDSYTLFNISNHSVTKCNQSVTIKNNNNILNNKYSYTITLHLTNITYYLLSYIFYKTDSKKSVISVTKPTAIGASVTKSVTSVTKVATDDKTKCNQKNELSLNYI